MTMKITRELIDRIFKEPGVPESYRKRSEAKKLLRQDRTRVEQLIEEAVRK